MPSSVMTDVPPEPVAHLAYLESLRALAALYVTCFHLSTVVDMRRVGTVAHACNAVLLRGHQAVGVFIVLSGYCLMLPVLRDPAGRLRGGVRQFVRRRARRILPPYYAALALSVPVAYFAKRMVGEHLSPGSVAAHALLVHNLVPAWSVDLNGVLWTVATEWQIYFAFALVLLPTWQRAGTVWAVAVAFALGCLVYGTPVGPHLYNACFWYLGLFSLGMAAATVARPRRGRPLGVGGRRAALVAAVLMAGVAWTLGNRPSWLLTATADVAVGVAAAALLVYCDAVRFSRTGVMRVLHARPLCKLGEFSYSLYLVHLPVLGVVDWVIKRRVQNYDGLYALQFTRVAAR